MSIEKAKETVGLLEKIGKLTETKAGMFTLGAIFVGSILGFVIWILFSQVVKKDQIIEKQEAQIAMLIDREIRIRDECLEMWHKWTTGFKSVTDMLLGSVNLAKSAEVQTQSIIQQQQNIISKTTNDETN